MIISAQLCSSPALAGTSELAGDLTEPPDPGVSGEGRVRVLLGPPPLPLLPTLSSIINVLLACAHGVNDTGGGISGCCIWF